MRIRIKNIAFMLLLIGACFVFSGFASAAEGDFAQVEATLLNQNPDPGVPGKYLEIRWKIQKYGNAKIDDLSFVLETKYPFYFDQLDHAEKPVGDWEGYSSSDDYFTLYYKVRVDDNALEDSYNLVLKAKTSKRGYVETQKLGEYNIRVGKKNVSEFVLGTLTTSPTRLVSDTDEASLSFSLENIGDADAENVKVQLQLPDGFTPTYSYSDRYNIGTIAGGGSGTATFYVDIGEDVKGGSYDSNLMIDYKDADDKDNEYKTVVMPITIPVKNKPKFSIESVTTDPQVIRQGDSVNLKLILKNVGGEKAESVSIRAFKDSSQPFDFDEKSDFVGTLKPGEEGEAMLKLAVGKDASPKKYILDLEIRSIYASEVVVQEKQITVEVQNGEKKSLLGGNGITGLLVVAVIVSVGLAVYYGMRKGKK